MSMAFYAIYSKETNTNMYTYYSTIIFNAYKTLYMCTYKSKKKIIVKIKNNWVCTFKDR